MKKPVYHLTLFAIVLLIGLSIYGAFIGAENAQAFFNNIPLTIFWIFTALLVIVSLIIIAKLRKSALLLMHIGVVLVLVGSMAASEKGHHLRRIITGRGKPVDGFMVIYEGHSSNELFIRDTNEPYVLDFEIHLRNFRIEYYPKTAIVKDYLSEVEVVADGDMIKSGIIEVNHPLHLEEFHFYQYDNEEDASGRYTILQVVSDSGLFPVFFGYACLCVGVFWYFWFIRLRQR